ncbi:MAG: tRNA (adenosine(37)-N6)-threonylcarbamoyltransferase complex ATPase subunit type 1 TsaE [Bacilli bacterium]|nr:tRNA (adenosine(37)-N6)-threonylcarbamoyltransferase complex ATPase subunit type 1 TsaE [Bacilli bacterium]
MRIEFNTISSEQTKALGEFVSSFFTAGDVVLLKGDLGAGKTTFVGGVAKGLEIKEDVISPTFNIMKCYFKGKLPMYHIDAYRLENMSIEIGLDEYIEGDGVCLIEWPQYILPLIPDDHLDITLLNKGDNHRHIVFESDSTHFSELIEGLRRFSL